MMPSIIILTEASIAKMEYTAVLLDMAGSYDISATLFLIAVIQGIKLYLYLYHLCVVLLWLFSMAQLT